MIRFTTRIALLENYEQHGPQLGSNPGGVFIHKDTGQKSYIKFPANPEQAKTEVATAKIYHHLGIKTLNPTLEHVNGKLGVKTDWNDQLSNLGKPTKQATTPEHANQLALMHHAAVITGNQDVVGLDYDNIMKHHNTKDLYSIDQGGSMNFRAQGAEKPFDANIDLLHSFKTPRYTAQHVFGKAHEEHPDSHNHAVTALKNLKDEHIDAVVSDVGLHSAISDVIKKRRDMLINHFGN